MQFKSLQCLLVACFLVPGDGRAQDEVLHEIDELISEFEVRRDEDAVHQLEYQNAVDLLLRAQSSRQSAIRTERQLERAEEKNDQEIVDSLEHVLEKSEIEVEACFALLELFESRLELKQFIEELQEDSLSLFIPEAEALVKLQDDRIELATSYFEQSRETDEERFEAQEDQLATMGRDFVYRHSVLELRVELYWAREEDDYEQIQELKEELEEVEQQSSDDDGSRLRMDRRRSSGEDATSRRQVVHPVEASAQDVAAAARLSFDRSVVPLLKKYCYECHDGASASGDLNLEQLGSLRPFVSNRRHWLNVKQQIRIRSMPPADAAMPSDEDRRVLVAWLTHSIDQFDYSLVRQPGYEGSRRLTHAEYNNTIRDLLGVDLRPADQFPVDMKATSGFENSSNSLFIQPVLMERYVGAAEQIVFNTLSPSAPPEQRQVAETIVIGEHSPKEAMLAFAARAWRRALQLEEQEQLTSYFENVMSRPTAARQALLETIQVILLSPKFLMRAERGPENGNAVYTVSNYELASRLSYFLWASMPDAELFEKASQNALYDRNVLKHEVMRMLDDPKAETLGQLFAAQWLGFGNLHHIQPDQIDNPWATDSLLQAMKDESSMLFTTMIKDDLPIETLITADYTFLNQELAEHYRINGVSGNHMRRVDLRNSHRGGILGHGSVLAVTSFPGRTSPVVRGNWVLTELLGTPPPPPPPNVSQFDENVEERESLSARQKLELHRRNPNCYVCHNEIDPLGFALEEFDWFGRQRSGREVDAEGVLPSGTVVNGLAGLRVAIIKERRDDLVEQLTRKMLSYALGRQLEYYDEATVAEIIAAVEQSGRRMRSLVLAIIRSEAFQKKQFPKE